jgi:uncharacterized membrane protein
MAPYHPQFVHFAIALLAAGVVFRIISLIGRPAFVAPAALSLLGAGTLAAALAVQSGTAAHGPVERIPGARQAVVEHEEWGIWTRNVFFGVIALEALGLLLYRSPRQRLAYIASAVVGVGGLVCLYEAGEHGGELVYAYAGGVGTRSGDPADVERLLLAGLYNQAQVERKAGRGDRAAQLLALAAERHPNDVEVQMAGAESLLLDRKDARAAIEKLRAISPPPDNRSLRIRHGMLTADALEAAGQREGAAAVVQTLVTLYPDVPRLKQRLDALSKPKPAP